MKLVACDVKTIFCFGRFGGVMGSGLVFASDFLCSIKIFSIFFFVSFLQQVRNAFGICLCHNPKLHVIKLVLNAI